MIPSINRNNTGIVLMMRPAHRLFFETPDDSTVCITLSSQSIKQICLFVIRTNGDCGNRHADKIFLFGKFFRFLPDDGETRTLYRSTAEEVQPKKGNRSAQQEAVTRK